MNPRFSKVTAVLVAVIFLIGVVPVLLPVVFQQDSSPEVKVILPDKQIKSIPLEKYLVGVVAAEMPAEFELEALKAQAVAARTYALKKVEKRAENSLYDLDTTEQTQVWNSREDMVKKWGLIAYFKYKRKISKAVKQTEGQTLLFDGEKIDAVYHSSSGRKNTEKASEVWNGEAAYLTNVPSGEANPLRFVAHKVFDITTFYSLLGFSQIPSRFNEEDLIIVDRTKAGRIKTLAIRNRVFEGTDIRKKLQLASTDFEWKIQNNSIEIITYGKGHAVGMSQYGANDLAKSGKKYQEILKHFYRGVTIEKLY
ncbi:MAG: stage II sporulation protein D [Peptococcaceae bacterium]|nr:stage II sporulation protein D [Peptococcaceae bacterium]